MKKSCLAILVCLGLASCSVATGQGLEAGRLRPCPASPNCVISEAPGGDVQPFVLQGEDGWGRLRLAIVSQGGDYRARGRRVFARDLPFPNFRLCG